MGGKLHTTKNKAEFIICSLKSSKKILEDRNHPLHNKKLVSIRFLAALAFGHCTKEGYKDYQFTINTPEEDDICPCTKYSNHNGIKEYPILLLSYWEEMNKIFPNDKIKVTSLFNKFLEHSNLHLDVLHYVKGNWMVVMYNLEVRQFIDIKKFKENLEERVKNLLIR